MTHLLFLEIKFYGSRATPVHLLLYATMAELSSYNKYYMAHKT